MISDLARLSIKIQLYLSSLFRKKPEPPPAPIVTVLEDVIEKISAAQNASREKIDTLTSEAAALRKTITEKEEAQIARWKNEIQEFLRREGIDCACIDEFLKDPSPEKLEEFRIKYPGVSK